MEHAEVSGMDREQRLAEWIEEYSDSILRTCFLYLSDLGQAEDAMQDTWIKAWKHMSDYDQKGYTNEKAWLLRIAINTCKDYRRSAWFRHMDRRITPENLPEKAQEVHFPDGEVSGAISSLPAKLRMVILLRYYEGFTVQETAETAGVSVATAKRQIRKANQLLRKKLEGWYYDE